MPTARFTVNGQPVSVEVENRRLLVEVLRDALEMTGTHVGCDTSQCGCCTVLIDGRPAKACATLAVAVEGRAVTTIEGIRGADGGLHPVQQAFVECHGLQCGFCTPGMVVSTCALLASNPKPSDDEIVHALEGNLCRCTGYVNIVESVRRAAAALDAPRG
jgi:carbon-monoxide dehydrogenase small subunit